MAVNKRGERKTKDERFREKGAVVGIPFVARSIVVVTCFWGVANSTCSPLVIPLSPVG